MLKQLKLIFPQWQGSGHTKELLYGANKIHEKILPDAELIVVPVEMEQVVEENNILGYQPLLGQLETITNLLSEEQPETIFSIGGGCDIEVAPISYLNKKYEGNLGVIWLDAHADLNTPESSPSKLFHGMPLRTLLGEGNQPMLDTLPSFLKPDQILLAGARELDEAEQAFIEANKITVIGADDILDFPSFNLPFDHLYVHIDLDVLDPSEFPEVLCPTPGGILNEQLVELIQYLTGRFNIVGMSAVEYRFISENEKGTTLLQKICEAGMSI